MYKERVIRRIHEDIGGKLLCLTFVCVCFHAAGGVWSRSNCDWQTISFKLLLFMSEGQVIEDFFFSLSAPIPSCKLSCTCSDNGLLFLFFGPCVFMAMSASNKMHEWMNICHILISRYPPDEHKPARRELQMSLSACCCLYVWPCAVCDCEAAQMSLCGFATRIYSSDE